MTSKELKELDNAVAVGVMGWEKLSPLKAGSKEIQRYTDGKITITDFFPTTNEKHFFAMVRAFCKKHNFFFVHSYNPSVNTEAIEFNADSDACISELIEWRVDGNTPQELMINTCEAIVKHEREK